MIFYLLYESLCHSVDLGQMLLISAKLTHTSVVSCQITCGVNGEGTLWSRGVLAGVTPLPNSSTSIKHLFVRKLKKNKTHKYTVVYSDYTKVNNEFTRFIYIDTDRSQDI